MKPTTPLRVVTLAIQGKDGQKRQLTWQQPYGTSITEALVKALDALLSEEEGK
jgi:hypothetical protein